MTRDSAVLYRVLALKGGCEIVTWIMQVVIACTKNSSTQDVSFATVRVNLMKTFAYSV